MDPLLSRLTALPRRRLIVGGAVALLVVVGAAVVAGATAGGSEVPVPAVTRAAAAVPTAASPTPLLVQVVGQVRRPGLVAVRDGARAVDAISAAGGATADADESGVNLAARVVDGEQVVVPKRGAAPSAAPGTAGAGGTASTAAPVSLGSATEAQLETLPRVGPAMAARIIAYRTAHGGFRSVDDLSGVSGIGPKTLAALRGLVVP